VNDVRGSCDAADYLLTEAGFSEVAIFTRAPREPEKQLQGYLLLRRPA